MERRLPVCIQTLRQTACNALVGENVLNSSVYASQLWGTEYIREGKEFSSELRVHHMSFLQGTLGVKRATTNWSVLRECGHVPLQFYWFKSAVKMYIGLILIDETLRKVLNFSIEC
eukprot:1157716-Pelagomonas_calceolata.AAC.12